ncbi:hypothetical protein IGI04_036587 [Brassica rapa subsp. trilocularis]|uniref:Uncharacterized protein n=1 Tax=Brassica rapa subsp. trilocularis TaxID=1813537 RepID=A0ABQ7LEW7_BRACM|nr:hypothetical protein IGI04_036587 [Brassica rapa subsp. trilocularis]
MVVRGKDTVPKAEDIRELALQSRHASYYMAQKRLEVVFNRISPVTVYDPSTANKWRNISFNRFSCLILSNSDPWTILVQSFFLADVVPTLSVSDSSERDGVSKLASSSWGPVKLGGCNRVESLQISILASSYLVRVCSLLVFVIVAYHGEPGHGCGYMNCTCGFTEIYDYLGMRVKQEIHIYLFSHQFVLTGKQLFTP